MDSFRPRHMTTDHLPRRIPRMISETLTFWKYQRWLSAALFVGVISCSIAKPTIQAAEPFDRFITRLKEERLFDLALAYLEQQSQLGGLTVEQTNALGLERALLLQQSSIFQRGEAAKADRLSQSETAFQQFLSSQTEHPRRSEAKMGLGNLLLTRGDKSAASAGNPPTNAAKLQEAAGFFKKSEELFLSTLQELGPKLKDLQGARVADDQADKIELRNRYRGEYSQAQLLAAYAHQRFAECQPAGSEEQKKELQAAEKLFTEFYLNKTRADGLRNMALFYRGQIQTKLGKPAEALDSFQRIADLVDVPDELRGLKTRAITELVKLYCDPAQAKYEAAVETAQNWVEKMTSAEGKETDWLELQIALAEAQLLAAKKLKDSNGGATAIKNLEDRARRGLQATMRVVGDHQDRARNLLAQIGVEATGASIEDKPVKTFTEALQQANARLAESESVSLTFEILRQQRDKTTDEAEKAKLDSQIKQAEDDNNQEVAAIGELLVKALSLYTEEDNRSQLQEARYLLSYTYLKRDQLWEAAATSGFTAKSSAGESWGLQSGMICLNSYQRMLQQADEPRKDFILEQLRQLAEFLLKTWPAAEESQQAARLLVQLTMIEGNFDKAREYMQLVPASTAVGGKLRRQLGLSLWESYSKKLAAAGDNPNDPSITAARDLALATLKEGVIDGGVSPEADILSVEAPLALINLWMLDGKVTESAELLNQAEKGPLTLLEKYPELASQGTTALRAFQAALQVNIAQLATQSDGAAVERVQQLVDKLGTLAGEDEEGRKKLAAVFYRLAKDFQQQLEANKDPAARDRMASGIGVVLNKLRSSTKDATTKLWVGQTLAGIAKAVRGNGETPSASSVKLNGEAVAALDELRKDPNSSPDLLIKVRFVMAQSLQNNKQYPEAMAIMEEILSQNPAMLDVQVEAARMLQQWSGGKTAEQLTKAVNGYLPSPKNRQNAIWGWGRISVATAGKPNLEKTFFEARLELARCRYWQGLLEQDPAKREKLLQRAKSDIGQTLFNYPQLGGPEFTERFDKLCREIQRELKQQDTGLKGLK